MPTADTLRPPHQGNGTRDRAAQGYATSFHLPGLSLVSASIADNVATLTFNDPNNATSGGSCRTQLLRYEIEKTEQQFPNVRTVQIKPDTLFQP